MVPPFASPQSKRLRTRLRDKATVAGALVTGCVLGYLARGASLPFIALDSATSTGSPNHNCMSSRTRHKSCANAAKSTVKEEPGWKTLHVYYGDASNNQHFAILEPLSQANQDEYVLALLRHKKGGFFVDLAAHDATHLSNTFTLERDYDWNGSTYTVRLHVWRRTGALLPSKLT
jgi:hypothetical protein